jgi:hypothetical protein
MLIAVVSDTHRNSTIIRKVANIVEEADILIHLGDNVADIDELKEIYKNKIISVRGNCDFTTKSPIERVEDINEVRILVTHGHKYDVKSGIWQLKDKAKEVGADIALFGHTHISEINFEDGIWIINPGSASLPRDGQRSIAFIEIEDAEIRPSIHSI